MRAWRDWSVIFVAWIVLAAGCAPRITPIGPGNVYQPEKDEKILWQTTEKMSKAIQQSGGLYRNEKLQRYAQGVLDRLLGQHQNAYLPLKPRVFILDAASTNAFALPHGDIFIHTGMLGRIRSEAQLAMVLGHEITHSTHRHSYQACEHAYDASGVYAYLSVLSALAGSNAHRAVSQVGGLILVAAVNGYSREKEEESDKVGLTLVAQAGYDPAEGAKMFSQMMDAADPDDNEPSLLYANHPRMRKRVEYCATTLKALPPELITNAKDVGEDRYLDVAFDLILDEVNRHILVGRFKLAAETVDYLTQRRPGDSRVLCAAGDLYRVRNEAGDLSKARESYSNAITAAPRSAPPRKGLGLLCARADEKAEAVIQLQNYLSLDPQAADAPYIRQFVEQLSKGQR